MYYFCFEGLDGVGKTTILQEVANKLYDLGYGDKLYLTKEPGNKDDAVNYKLREFIIKNYFNNQVEYTLAFALDCLRHLEILKSLPNDFIVLSDRCYLSDLAYRNLEGINDQEVKVIWSVRNYVLDKFTELNPNILFINVNFKTLEERLKGREKLANEFEKTNVLGDLERIKEGYNGLIYWNSSDFAIPNHNITEFEDNFGNEFYGDIAGLILDCYLAICDMQKFKLIENTGQTIEECANMCVLEILNVMGGKNH